MKRSVVALASMGLTLLMAMPARAWDPDAAAWSDPPPDLPPTAVPEGIYLVTETYLDDIVTRAGQVTTYGTATVHETTGSYARVLETVATGARSSLDGSAFNGRGALTDGRPVAGTFYENFVRTDAGFVAVSVVFFQDDLEIARAARPADPVSARVGGPQISPPGPPAAAASPSGVAAPVIDIAPGRPEPLGGRVIPAAPNAPSRAAPGALPERQIEVLRGRRMTISFPDPGLVGWRFISGEGTVIGPVSGAAGQDCSMRWDRLPPVGGTWVARFVLEFGGGVGRELAIRVTVRAPGLLE